MTIGLLLIQGRPNMGASGAGAGTLDFLRNSQQVSLSLFMWMYMACGNECHVNSYLELHSFCLSLFQFQALRAMVQANPQILQVIL